MMSIAQSPRPSRVYGRNQPTNRGTLIVWLDADGRERTRTWPNALPGHRSTCRADSGKGLRQHRCSVAHRAMVDGYRSWAHAAEQAAEAATGGYETELAEYWATHTRPTFKAYLQGLADPARHDAA